MKNRSSDYVYGRVDSYSMVIEVWCVWSTMCGGVTSEEVRSQKSAPCRFEVFFFYVNFVPEFYIHMYGASERKETLYLTLLRQQACSDM